MANRQLINIAANFAGVGAALLIPLVFQVSYYRLLGSESYGLVGLYSSLVLIASFLDMGLATTTVREFARRAAVSHRLAEMRPLFLTLVIIYCGIGVLLGSVTAALAPWTAMEWLHPTTLTSGEVAAAVAMMGLMLALSFPSIVFNATLSGIQRQVVANIFGILASVSRGAFVLISLEIAETQIVTFFKAQLVFSGAEVVALAILTWRLLPSSSTPFRFDTQFVKSVWRFSSANGLTALIGQIIMFGDRFILSAMLPLNLFGMYTFATTISSVIAKLSAPFGNAYFPHFVELLEHGQVERLASAYHFITQLASAVLIPAGICVAFYSEEIIFLLTNNADNAYTMAPVVTMLAVANTLNTLMWLPHTLQLASGVTWIALRMNVVQLLLYLPALWLLVPRFGIYAPAALWLTINFFSLPFFIAFTHRVALRREAWEWSKFALVIPACMAVFTFAVGLTIAPARVSWLTTVPWLAFNLAVAVAIDLACAPRTHRFIRRQLQKFWSSVGT